LQQNSKWRLKRGEIPSDFDAPGLVRTSPAAANINQNSGEFWADFRRDIPNGI
jgi:hypothetical protein